MAFFRCGGGSGVVDIQNPDVYNSDYTITTNGGTQTIPLSSNPKLIRIMCTSKSGSYYYYRLINLNKTGGMYTSYDTYNLLTPSNKNVKYNADDTTRMAYIQGDNLVLKNIGVQNETYYFTICIWY